MVNKLKRTNGMCDLLNTVALSMCEIVHGIDTPFVAGAVMVLVFYTIHKRVAEEQVGMRHINFRTERFFTIFVLAAAHFFKETKIIFNTTVAEWTVCAWCYCRTLCCGYFFCREIIHISQAFFDKGHSKFI